MVAVGVTDGVNVTVAVAVGAGGVAVAVGVYGGAQPPLPQASQQLLNTPVQALPPEGARHLLGADFTAHLVVPRALVRQQVTAPTRPQVDFEAHLVTLAPQLGDSAPPATEALITPLAQRR
jgi:hypothetical protein